MRDSFLDLTIELPAELVAREPDPGRFILEAMRRKADETCDRNFGRLRTDSTPEIIISRGIDRTTGVEMVLAASRWPVVIPDAIAP